MGAEKTVKRFIIVLLCLLLAGLGYVYTSGYKMNISEAQIQQKINAKLPFSKNYYVMFKATLSHADVQLMHGKVHIVFDARLDSLNPMVLMGRSNDNPALSLLSGTADIVALPEYNSETGQVFLSQVNVLSMNIKGVSDGAKFKPAVRKLALAYLAKHPVYTLKNNNFKKMLAKLFLKDITVEDHALTLVLGI